MRYVKELMRGGYLFDTEVKLGVTALRWYLSNDGVGAKYGEAENGVSLHPIHLYEKGWFDTASGWGKAVDQWRLAEWHSRW